MYLETEQPGGDGCQPPQVPVSPGGEPGLPPRSGVGFGTWRESNRHVWLLGIRTGSDFQRVTGTPPPHQINCTFTLWPNNSIPEIYYKEILTQFHKGPGQEM